MFLSSDNKAYLLYVVNTAPCCYGVAAPPLVEELELEVAFIDD